MPDDFIKNQNVINIKHPVSDHEKDAQKIYKYISALNKAKLKIRQNLIVSDNSNNKETVYTAITQFKKTNE